MRLTILVLSMLVGSFAYCQPQSLLHSKSIDKDSAARVLINQCIIKEFLIQDFLMQKDQIAEMLDELNNLSAIKTDKFGVDSVDEYTMYTIVCDSSFLKALDRLYNQGSNFKYVKSSILAWFHNTKSITVIVHSFYGSSALYRVKGFKYDDKVALMKIMPSEDKKEIKKKYNQEFKKF